MTAHIIQFRHLYPANERLNIGFIAGLGFSIACWAWLIVLIICLAMTA